MVSKTVGVLTIILATTLFAAPASTAAEEIDTSRLRDALTVSAIRDHQRALQVIADQHGGNRAAGSPGYQASADYVADKLSAAGYRVTTQPFSFPYFVETAPPELSRVAGTPRRFEPGTEVRTMTFSGSGTVTAPVSPVDLTLPPPPTSGSTSGCEAADFATFPDGHIALLQRGTCPFAQKVRQAKAAGAGGVILMNEGQPGRQEPISGTLDEPGIGIPVVTTSFAVGVELAERPGVMTRLITHTVSEVRQTVNVLADSPGGRTDRVIVVGAHLDSVPEGPGINDNGSGVATIVAVAEQIAALGIEPRNQLRFAFWGAEELGLLGSTHYVTQLPPAEREKIALNLNFDMVGSPNFARFVYDGDGSAGPPAGPAGSAGIERMFTDYFAAQGLVSESTPFNGRSDYGPFIEVGIPAGGVFSGAGGIKTPEQAARYGGTAGRPYDSCYHQACDTFMNVSEVALDQLGDAAAHGILRYARTATGLPGRG